MARVRLGFGLWVGFRARARLCLGLELISLAERTPCQVNLLRRGFSADGMGRSRGQKAYYVIVCALQSCTQVVCISYRCDFHATFEVLH